MLVWVVDDKANLLATAKLMLERGLEHEVVTFEEPECFLERFGEEHGAAEGTLPDIVFVDNQMPPSPLSGLMVCGVVRSLSPELPLILFTGATGGNLRAQAKNSGVDVILTKPCTMLPMKQAIDTAVELRKLERIDALPPIL